MADKEYKNILIEREGNITFLWLNRPDKRNAMSPDLHFEMEDALTWLATDKEIREQHVMKQFLDDKSYRPGLGPFKRVENA